MSGDFGTYVHLAPFGVTEDRNLPVGPIENRYPVSKMRLDAKLRMVFHLPIHDVQARSRTLKRWTAANEIK